LPNSSGNAGSHSLSVLSGSKMSELKAFAAAAEPVMTKEAKKIWRLMQHKLPELKQFDCPEIILNNRLRSTAGRCWMQSNKIDIATKYLMHSQAYQIYVLKIILPHELAHQADFNVFGESELACGHGKNWQFIMTKVLNLPANKYHKMERL
jgi:predicted SprT family Zn-dependent metalloprotease